jgi:hypothetical protein
LNFTFWGKTKTNIFLFFSSYPEMNRYYKQQPRSLRWAAVKAFADDISGRKSSWQRAEQLIASVNALGGMKTINLMFDVASYEKILLQVLKMRDTCESKMQRIELAKLFAEVKEGGSKYESHLALGLFSDQQSMRSDRGFLHDSDFRLRAFKNARLPAPVLQSAMMKLLPGCGDPEDLGGLAEEELRLDIWDNLSEIEQEDDLHTLLWAMSVSLMWDRAHEVVGYAADICGRPAFRGHGEMFRAWAMLAHVLSVLCRPIALVKSCLVKMNQLANKKLESVRVACLFYEQTAMSLHHGFSKKSWAGKFAQIASALPPTCRLFYQACVVEINFMMAEIEDVLLVAICFADWDVVPPELMVLQCRRKMKNLEQFMHGLATELDLDAHFVLLEIYELCLDHFNDDEFERRKNMKRLARAYTHIDYFVRYYNETLPLDSYEWLLKCEEDTMTRSSRRNNTVRWAQVCIVHALFWGLLVSPADPHKLEYLQKARDVYQRTTDGRHYRIELLDQALRVHHIKTIQTEFNAVEIGKANHFVKFEWLLVTDPWLKKMTKFGVSSAQKNNQ